MPSSRRSRRYRRSRQSHRSHRSRHRRQVWFDLELAYDASEAFDISLDYAVDLIHGLRYDRCRHTRHLDFVDRNEQLELIRLEAQRLQLLSTMNPPTPINLDTPSAFSSEQTYSGISPTSQPGRVILTAIGPGSTVPSESDISFLDIGPGLSSSREHTSTRAASTRAASTLRHPAINGSDVMLTGAEPARLDYDSDDYDITGPARLPIDEPIEILNLPNPEDPVAWLERARRRADPDLDLILAYRGIIPPRSSSPPLSPDHISNVMRYYVTFNHLPVEYYFDEDIDRHIRALSVPHSPLSPSAGARPWLPRSHTSFEGMEPEFAAMRTEEQAREALRAAAPEAVIDQDENTDTDVKLGSDEL
ncbi:hypothetical protein N7541_008810 [Penicillium brevicompactum]|uniref:Uncharacterized protein n=1 Tax=Penicillium brevicompactum TaxID=5074 RepID=A0A9W9ULM1_PENBR|nr:hypothetical protein N7541_008810 [Penicillium brevicompactum]